MRAAAAVFQDPRARTLPAILERAAADWGDKPLVLFDDMVVSYRDLWERARLFAGALAALGVRPRDTVAILLSNRWEYLEVWWGICLLGAVEVPVNFGLKGKLLEHVLKDSEAALCITEAAFLPELEPVLAQVPALQRLIVVDERAEAVGGRPALAFRDLPRQASDLPALRYGDLAGIMYTSGSTGAAKGVMLSHNYFLRFGEEKARHLRTGPSDVIHNCYPLFNASGQFEAVMAAMSVGATVYQAPRFSASRFWQEIRQHRCTEFIYMGGILSLLDKQPARADDADNPVRAGYGVPTPVDLHPRFEQRFGCVLVEVYGSTEANTVTFNPYDARKWGSCGLPTAGYEVRLVDADDNPVGPGEVGEMLVRPTRAHSILEGYWRQPQRTAEVFGGLWYRTGDLLRADEDGYHFFVGRKGDTVRHRGYTFAASQVEEVVNGFPEVLESAVVGIASDSGEDDLKLLFVARGAPDPEALRRRCERELPAWMVPRYIELREGLPKTPTQKIEKYRLRQEGVTPATIDFGAYRPRQPGREA
ncbi:MAG: AMP-binding protein [Dongiaceae bacterium]